MPVRFIEKIQLIERIDQMIRMKATGSSRELAKKVGISKSTLYEILGLMRDLGAEISYDNYRKTYFYEINKAFQVGFSEFKKLHDGLENHKN